MIMLGKKTEDKKSKPVKKAKKPEIDVESHRVGCVNYGKKGQNTATAAFMLRSGKVAYGECLIAESLGKAQENALQAAKENAKSLIGS